MSGTPRNRLTPREKEAKEKEVQARFDALDVDTDVSSLSTKFDIEINPLIIVFLIFFLDAERRRR
jgi:hypothetical protein